MTSVIGGETSRQGPEIDGLRGVGNRGRHSNAELDRLINRAQQTFGDGFTMATFIRPQGQ